MIKVEHLQKTYNLDKTNSTHAINDISFSLPDKGMIFIVGKSGSGKSTLLNILGGLDDFDSGSVIVDGNDLSKMSHSDFNKYRSGYQETNQGCGDKVCERCGYQHSSG